MSPRPRKKKHIWRQQSTQRDKQGSACAENGLFRFSKGRERGLSVPSSPLLIAWWGAPGNTPCASQDGHSYKGAGGGIALHIYRTQLSL